MQNFNGNHFLWSTNKPLKTGIYNGNSDEPLTTVYATIIKRINVVNLYYCSQNKKNPSISTAILSTADWQACPFLVCSVVSCLQHDNEPVTIFK